MKIKVDYAECGFDGVLYPANGRLDKVIIVVSGSDGGLGHAKKMARWFQQNNVPTLAVGYFATKHTGKYLEKVPIEYIDRAVSFLKQQGYEKVGIQGLSKGTEYAILAAAENTEISCVILKTPSWFASEVISTRQPSASSCWTRNGEEIPYTPYKIRQFNLLQYMKETGEYNLLKVNSGKDVTQESVLPIEKVNGPVLLFSTEADNIWPSKEGAEKLMSLLDDAAFVFPHKHICYRCMCHFMMENANSMTRLISKSEKQYPEECAAERKNMGEETLNWIEKVWQ